MTATSLALEAPIAERQTVVTWMKSRKKRLSRIASRDLLDESLYHAVPYRMPDSYPKQVNTHGSYFFTQTGKHVWTESRLEMYILAAIDMQFDVRAVATQPMRIDFVDGTHHVPDFIALHANGNQIVYDVKPLAKITPSIAKQFTLTREFCKQVGFGYKVCTELPPQVQANVQYLWNYRAMDYDPGARTTQRIQDALQKPTTLASVALATDLYIPEARIAIFHLLWKRAIHTNLNRRLTDSSILERSPHAAA